MSLGQAQAAQLKSVQYGTTTITAGSASATGTLNPTVDTSKAFLVFGVSEDSVDPKFGQISGQITANNLVTFQRNTDTSSPAVTVKWYVAAFT